MKQKQIVHQSVPGTTVSGSPSEHLTERAVVFAFACRVSGTEWGETIINALSAGEAKAEHFRHVHDAWECVKYTDIRCRKVGQAHTSERFKANAAYRGMPDVRCGDAVTVGDWHGVIVGHNSSANFNVLATDGPYKGVTLNVHPSEFSPSAKRTAPQGEG